MREVAGVAKSREVVDVLVGHLQRALENQGFEHRRVEPSVGLGVLAQGSVGDRRVLQCEHEGPAEVRVDVTHPQLTISCFGWSEVCSVVELLQVEVAPDRGGERLLLGRLQILE